MIKHIVRASLGVAFAAIFVASALAQSFPGQAPAGTIYGNSSASSAVPFYDTLNKFFDRNFCATQNDLVIRGASAWACGLAGNASLANMNANTFKGNPTGSSATPSDFTIDSLTLKASPVAADEVPCWDVAGTAMKKCTVSGIGASAGVSSFGGQTGAIGVGGLLGMSGSTAQVVAASKSDQQTGTSTTLAVTPSQQQSHDSAAKVHILFTASNCTILESYNVASCTRNSAGDYIIAFTTNFSSANYACNTTAEFSSIATQGGWTRVKTGGRLVASVEIQAFDYNTASFTAADPDSIHMVCYGRQ